MNLAQAQWKGTLAIVCKQLEGEDTKFLSRFCSRGAREAPGGPGPGRAPGWLPARDLANCALTLLTVRRAEPCRPQEPQWPLSRVTGTCLGEEETQLRPPKAEASEAPATPHLSHLVAGLGHSPPVGVWGVCQEVDQGPASRPQSHARLRRLAEVDEREVAQGCGCSPQGDAKLIQFDIHEESLGKKQD